MKPTTLGLVWVLAGCMQVERNNCLGGGMATGCAVDGGGDVPSAEAASCPAGQVRAYPQGCGVELPQCVPDTSGDAIAIAFCGCDGVTHTTSQWLPTRPWRQLGACGGDGGVEAAVDVAPAPDATALTCPLPPVDYSACSVDADCAMTSQGCFCGRQPVMGVAAANLALVSRCEAEAQRNCALGCAVMPGFQAQDGRAADEYARVAVRCERPSGLSGVCRTYVP